jgi:hypothetical protein
MPPLRHDAQSELRKLVAEYEAAQQKSERSDLAVHEADLHLESIAVCFANFIGFEFLILPGVDSLIYLINTIQQRELEKSQKDFQDTRSRLTEAVDNVEVLEASKEGLQVRHIKYKLYIHGDVCDGWYPCVLIS